MNKTFEGLLVIELASVLAGPSVGMFFAELGAKVIKIENKKTGGDITRTWKTNNENINTTTSAYYASINWGKEIIFLDYNNNDDYITICNLLTKADIVITNFKKGDDVKFKLNNETLKKINSQLIIGKINGFGTESNKVAYDIVLQAETGFMSMNGTQQSGPLKMPVALIDVLTAHQLKEGILIALLNKYKTGKGFIVDVSLKDSAICSLVNQASNYINNGEIAQLAGSLHPNIAPYGEIFETKDHIKIVLAIGSNKQFNLLCNVLDVNNVANNALFIDNKLRVKNRAQLFVILQQAIQLKTSQSLSFDLEANQVPFGVIKNINEVIDDLDANKFLNFANNDYKVLKSVVFNLTEL